MTDLTSSFPDGLLVAALVPGTHTHGDRPAAQTSDPQTKDVDYNPPTKLKLILGKIISYNVKIYYIVSEII